MGENRQGGNDRAPHSEMSEDPHPNRQQDQLRESQLERQKQNQQGQQKQPGGKDQQGDKSRNPAGQSATDHDRQR